MTTRTRQRTRTRPKKSGSGVSIDRQKRRQLHAVWPVIVMRQANSVCSEIRYYIRDGIWGEGLTPGEKKYLYERCQQLDQIARELTDFYYKRLKK
jgi:hypothetical protein